MANARRETTAFSQGNGRPDSVFASGNRPRQLTPPHSACQADSKHPPSALEAVVPWIAKAAGTAFAVHAATGEGSTVSVSEGNLAGLPLFAVSIYPGRTIDLAARPIWEIIFAFGLVNADLLFRPHHALGTWFDPTRKLHVLDVVVCPSSLNKAIRLGIRHRQKAIYDLKNGEAIALPSRHEFLTIDPYPKEK
jgi:hypothetical protein